MLEILATREGILLLTSIVSLITAIINLYTAYVKKFKKQKVSRKTHRH